MSEDALRNKLARMQQRVDLLEEMIEDRTREVYLANEKLRAAAEYLHKIHRTMPGALLVFDVAGRVEAVNAAACALLGYTEAELLGQPASLLFEKDAAQGFEQLRAASRNGEVLRAERRCRTKTGDTVPVFLSASLMEGVENEQSQAVVCVALDIRDRKHLERELQQAQKLESVGRLAAGVAHEINTPVQFVSDSVQYIGETLTDLGVLMRKYQDVQRTVLAGQPALEVAEEARLAEETADLAYAVENLPKALERSMDGLKRVADIVRSMKEFAHPDQKEMASVDLNRAIESTLVMARNEYKYVADVELSLAEIPRVTCHGGEVNQAILNIIVNASHAISDAVKGTAQRGKIIIRTKLWEGSVTISISDSGGGIPEAIQSRIFDPFFTTKEVGRGTGQGLAIARSVLVDKHGGDLTFDTVPGVGTTFHMRLPLVGKPRPSPPAQPSLTAHVLGTGEPGHVSLELSR